MAAAPGPDGSGPVAPPLPFSVFTPAGWETLDSAGGALVLADTTGAASAGMRASFAGSVREEPHRVTLDTLVGRHATEVVDQLDQPRVLDQGSCPIDDHLASRVLVAHRVAGIDVTLEEWVVPLRRRLLVFSASAATLDYVRLFAQFQDLIGSVEIGA